MEALQMEQILTSRSHLTNQLLEDHLITHQLLLEVYLEIDMLYSHQYLHIKGFVQEHQIIDLPL